MIQNLNVSRETLERLKKYQDLLEKWNKSINLVAKSTVPDSWSRHFEDSAQIYQLTKLADSWVDIGSGGGFPGLVCAVIASEKSPETTFTLVESDKRKATFLRQVANNLDLEITVLSQRIEEIVGKRFDTISARALAPLPKLLELSKLILNENGQCVFLKGTKHQSEVEDALENWSFSLQTEQSKTDPDAAILILENIHYVGA
jgi:16S rRNA (guanine527-N7)-methyltransferase